ncbi:putative ribonuclease H-like domain-containing protein [Tanacetum coccineum]
MDLCGPMRVASVNGKKYIIVIIDDYSRFTWVKCLRSKDEAPDFIIKFLKMIQLRLKAPEFSKGTVDPTLFIRRQGKDILLDYGFHKSQRHLYKPFKYALESLKKYGMESSDPVDTPIVEKSKLDEDTQGKAVDPTHYRGMVGTLMYLTASRSNLTFVVLSVCRHQAKPYPNEGIVYNAINK